MQRTSLAPVLSATLQRVSCWITTTSPSRRPRRPATDSSCRTTDAGPAGRYARPPSCPCRRKPPRRRAPCAGRGRSRRLSSSSGRSLDVLLSNILARLRRLDPVELELPLAEHRRQTRDVVAQLLEPRRVVELPGRQLEAQVEELFLRTLDPDVQIVVGQLAELDGLARHRYSPTLVMNFVLIGSLCCARNMASRASGSLTPDSSNMTRPGFTTATQPSGLPFPEPMRVSAGFFVTGLSGKIVIHTFPPRLI